MQTQQRLNLKSTRGKAARLLRAGATPRVQNPRHISFPQECSARTMLCRTATVDVATETEAPKTEKAEAPAPTNADTGYDASVVLQGFGWDSCEKGDWFKQLVGKIPEIKAAGITHLWLPPPSQSVAPQGYMPGQLYNLNSKYGNEEDIRALCAALNEAGIVPIADIVINHRCADEQVDGVWNKFRDDVTHDGKKIDWGQWAITGNDPDFKGTGNPDTGDDYGPAPDLDHLNKDLRAALTDWMKWLQDDIGFRGWRLDFVRGYGAKYVEEYISATTTGKALNIGEYWTDLNWEDSNLSPNQDGARQILVDWVNGNGKTACAFDFPTKGILQEAVKNTQYWRLKDGSGKASGGIGWLPSRMVTFIDNHDTGSTQNHWPFPADGVGQGNAYILTHPGMPCIFWDHLMTWKPEIRESIVKLIELRKRTGVNARSSLKIITAEDDMYVAEIGEKIVLKLGPRGDMGALVPSEKDGWKFFLSGKDWAVWEKSA